MRKLRKIKFLFLSGVLLSGLSFVVVSCGVKKETPTEGSGTGTGGSGTGGTSSDDNSIATALKNVKVSIQKNTDKQSVLGITKNNVKFTNYDQSKYDVVIEKLTTNNDEHFVEVEFYLVNKATKAKSSTKKYKDSSFVTEVSEDKLFEQESKKIRINFDNKQNVTAKDNAKLLLVYFENFDSKKYYRKIIKREVSKSNPDILVVTYQLKDRKTNKISKEFTYEVTGFKPEKLQELDDKFKTLTVDVKNKEKTKVSNLKTTDFTISGVDMAKYTVTVEKWVPKFDDTFLEVTLDVKSKEDPNFSYKKIVKLTNFEDVKFTKEKLDELAKKVKVDYLSKDQIAASKVQNNFRTVNTGTDGDLVGFVIESAKPEGDTLIVTYYLEGKVDNNKFIQSDKLKFTIAGFLPQSELDKKIATLNAVAKKVVFKLKDIEKTELKNVDLNALSTTVENNDGYKVEVIDRTKNVTDNSVTLKFSVNEDWDILENTSSAPATFILKGFKAP